MSSTLEHVDRARVGELSEVLERAKGFVETELYPPRAPLLTRRLRRGAAALARKARKGQSDGPVHAADARRGGRAGLVTPQFRQVERSFRALAVRTLRL